MLIVTHFPHRQHPSHASESNPHPSKPPKPTIARRAKPSVVPGHVTLGFTLDMPRELAERLSARAIRDGVNLRGARRFANGRSGKRAQMIRFRTSAFFIPACDYS